MDVKSQISKTSLKIFLEYAKQAGSWDGSPMVGLGEEFGSARAQRGNLTQLKRAWLLATIDEEGNNWILFSTAGAKLARENGIEFRDEWIKFI